MSGSILDQIANPPAVNPLANYKAALDVSSGINQNALFQAKRAQGLAFQNALNPDGSFDQQRYLGGIKDAGPTAGLGSLEAAQGGSTLAGTEQEQMIKRMGIMTGLAAPLLASGQPISKEQWVATLKSGVGSHGFTPAQIDAQAANIPDATPQNPYAVNDWLRGHVTAFINPTQAQLAYGTRPQVSTGDQTQFPNVPTIPATPGRTMPDQSRPPLTQQASPETAGSKVEWTDQNGVKQQGTWAQFAIEHGAGHTVGGAAPLPPQPGGNPLLGGMENPPETTNVPPNLSGPIPGTAAPPPNTYRATPGPAPGVTEAATETAKASAGMGNDLVKRADQVGTNKAQYANMIGDIERLKTMGAGTERETLINSVAQKLTGYGITMSPQELASAEGFAKASNQLIAAQVGALGPSDSRQALAMGGTPHLDLSKLGNTEIIHILQGNEDAIAAKAQAWQTWLKAGHSAGSYSEFSQDFSHNFDPRVFQAQYMGKTEIANLRASMNNRPGAEAKFMHDMEHARTQGWIK